MKIYTAELTNRSFCGIIIVYSVIREEVIHMYTKQILPGIDLYLVCLCLAILSALFIFRVMADKEKLSAKLQNLCLYIAVGAIFFGYISAVFFQALYNIKKNGGFVINTSTGATFYGGLIGGAALFLLLYFTIGKRMFPESREHVRSFFQVADIAACSIALAHAIGRVGCLMAGCCHGKRTNAWFGIYMDTGVRSLTGEVVLQKVVPTQLFETIFLLVVLFYLISRIREKQTYCLQLYMCIYGVWRFIIEYMRDDYRGTTLVDSLTPSQLIAVLMVLGGLALIFLQKNLQTNLAFDEAPRATSEGASVDETYEYEDEYDYDYGASSDKKDEEK